VVPTLISTLINGLGRFAGGPTSQLAVISVTSGKRYRMRLVSMSCDPNFTFTIDGHSMTIIEADSVNTEPLTVDSIQICTSRLPLSIT
jgi:iron transport multicopper oxidase